jgi:hypothetical protein
MDARNATVYYVLTGFTIFLAFITRENSAYFLLFFLPFAFYKSWWKHGIYFIGVGFIIPVAILYGIYYIITGDFFFALHLSKSACDSQLASGYIPPNSLNLFTMMWYMFHAEPFALTFIFGIPALLYTTYNPIKKDNYFGLIIFWWFVVCYLFIEFGTISFSGYHVMKKLPRFLLAMTPPLAIAYGVVLSDAVRNIGDHIRRSIVVLLAACIMLISSYMAIGKYHESLMYNIAPYRWVNYVLRDLPRKPIYSTGEWWNNKLSFYFMPDLRFVDINGHRSPMLLNMMLHENVMNPSGYYVIIGSNYYITQRPANWELIGEEYNTGVFIAE